MTKNEAKEMKEVELKADVQAEVPKESHAKRPQKKKEEAGEKEDIPVENIPEELMKKAVPTEEELKVEVKEVVRKLDSRLASWVPKTKVGKDVVAGKYRDINTLLDAGQTILEPEIVDYLIPELKEELIYIGGTPGKGGGIRRTPTRMTARMHKSGRRYKLSALMAVGNGDGIIGLGRSVSQEHRVAIEKANQQAKLNIIPVKRGCGSWECNCGGNHSVPYRIEGKVGSVRVILMPTPAGVGVVAGSEIKKIIKLTGIKDVWVETFGATSSRINVAYAVYDALRNLNSIKGEI